MAEQHSQYVRAEDDWYVEPEWAVHILLNNLSLINGFHDPCCGLGTIPLAGRSHGIKTSGSDLRQRTPGWGCENFLTDTRHYSNIVTNPPYKIALQIIKHALATTVPNGRVCALVQAKFLFSQKRMELFTIPEMERIIILSKRPSMPPGEMLLAHGESIRGNGSIDFLWAIWQVGKIKQPPTIEWIK